VETAGDDRGESDHNAAGVAVLLFPPASRRNWTVRGILLTIKLWVLDIFDPVPEEGTNAQVPNHSAHPPCYWMLILTLRLLENGDDDGYP
jgi:hypothetical protein